MRFWCAVRVNQNNKRRPLSQQRQENEKLYFTSHTKCACIIWEEKKSSIFRVPHRASLSSQLTAQFSFHTNFWLQSGVAMFMQKLCNAKKSKHNKKKNNSIRHRRVELLSSDNNLQWIVELLLLSREEKREAKSPTTKEQQMSETKSN